ncbi:MAG TPA: DUF6412 domain-containing protein [Streptosporangiaceae bacterium]|nr:DUF6412 domain-containing protein [Streptosporangiaceae bacterium]
MYPWELTELSQLGGYLAGLAIAITTPRDLLAITALALVGMVIAVLARGRAVRPVTAGPLPGRAAALREKAWRAAFQRLLDPDAAGRPRPRAPGSAPAAA